MAVSNSPSTSEPPAKKAKMSSFFRSKKDRLLPEPAAEAQPFNDLSAFIRAPRLAAYGASVSPSSGSIQDLTDDYMPSTSPSYSQPSPFPPINTPPVPIPADRRLPARIATPPPTRQSFVFGNSNVDGGLRTHNSEYFDKIKNNAYTSALLSRERSPNILVPRNTVEARELLKRGHYNKPNPKIPNPTTRELEKVLEDLRKRHAKLKAMSTSAGISISPQVWEETNTVIEEGRPDFNKIVDEDSYGELYGYLLRPLNIGLTRILGLKHFTAQLDKWDKAIGHKAILMKRMLYKQQIAELEKKVEQTKKAEATNAQCEDGEGAASGWNEGSEEWKGHKTRLGRRFKGLIEKE